MKLSGVMRRLRLRLPPRGHRADLREIALLPPCPGTGVFSYSQEQAHCGEEDGSRRSCYRSVRVPRQCARLGVYNAALRHRSGAGWITVEEDDSGAF